eukprot:TRINITY_DN1805_c0_g1_i1.p1 TRINITY_DN1805_c0_g1~~TRINITY_DN1805_c0_g1_i1.p1  ORF type:complete len:286 (+),score=107.67 TRINITY_DN1805_c0_g1_i1:151-1008(+)
MANFEHLNLNQWIEDNEDQFLPPVCNKLMSGGELKIMFVGGPNIRSDYHMEEGEELFYMVKGDMCLKIKEQGKPKDVHIKEGEIFVLPSRIPHSPQRNENTIGLVIERERLENELDGLGWYVNEDGDDILYYEEFHCTDLGIQLIPVIKRFYDSEEHKTGKPTKDYSISINLDTETVVDAPFNLQNWIDEHRDEINQGPTVLFDKGEFKVHANSHGSNDTEHNWEGETWFWNIDKKVTIKEIESQTETILSPGDVYLLKPNTNYSTIAEEGGVYLTIVMDPLANK